MPLFEKNNLRIFFVHIPKTGGTSIEQWLKNEARMSFYGDEHPTPEAYVTSPQHLRYTDMEKILGENFCDWAFALTREPYKRLESEYRWLYNNFDLSRIPLKFSEWAIKSMHQASIDPRYLDNHIRPQSDFLADDVDVFKLEDGLDIVAKKVSDVLNLDTPTKMSKKNISNTLHLEWSDEALAIANDFYAEDFIRFGYTQRAAQGKYKNIRKLRAHLADSIKENIPVSLRARRGLRKLFRLFKRDQQSLS